MIQYDAERLSNRRWLEGAIDQLREHGRFPLHPPDIARLEEICVQLFPRHYFTPGEDEDDPHRETCELCNRNIRDEIHLRQGERP